MYSPQFTIHFDYFAKHFLDFHEICESIFKNSIWSLQCRSNWYSIVKFTLFGPLLQNCVSNPGKQPLKIVLRLFNSKEFLGKIVIIVTITVEGFYVFFVFLTLLTRSRAHNLEKVLCNLAYLSKLSWLSLAV